ncbi:LysM peptidoglycan-binding domain-containing protein, partial [Psychromonas sp.]|uniref:LysM peptidoglycan-binding domain-containing protein n=1 Tax=Psychromonas sp. TaxID=1884585 RepID=UPI0035649009
MKLTAGFFIRFLFLSTLFIQAVVTTAGAAQTNKLKAVRAWPSPDNTRVVLDLSEQPDYQIHYLKHPDRLVIDLQSTTTAVDLKKVKHDGPLVNNLRESASGQKNTYRLVVDLNRASQAKIFVLPPAKPYGHRLVVDLPHNELSTTSISKPLHQQPQGRDIIIAIDAGHGGDDPGAVGKYSYEKNITLQIARRLHRIVNKQNGMSAFLIRNGDYFVDLNKRSAIARKGEADFLVSIHADGFTSTRPRGASVLVLSMRRATTEQGRWMENHEARSELIGGAGVFMQDSNNLPYLQKMVLDMSMGNSMDVGFKVGEFVVGELKQVTTLHQSKPVHASLAVLKSPDIPSILVEAGFITNRTEERLLNQAEHQNKIAQAVFKGIYKHFTQSPPQDTLFAQKKRSIKHTVRSGESLSALAERYSVGLSNLKDYNNLKSASLQVGQVLNIPPNYHLVVTPEPPRQTVPSQQPERIHKVTRGQSLSVIAAQYDMTTDSLKSFNNLSSTSLAIGQNLRIPGKYVDLPVVNANFRAESVHTVSRGQSLSLIAAQYDTTVETLKTFNKLRSTSLQVGQKLKIPATGVQPEIQQAVQIVQQTIQADRVHQVARGESLSVIAEQYGTTTGILKVFNELRSTSLQVGQKIKIPAGGGVQAPVQETVQVVQQTFQPERIHHVTRGESLSVIAEQYGTTTDTLKTFNELRSTSLRVGQKIKIPATGVQAPVQETVQVVQQTFQPERIHHVTRGESLSVIAEQYGTTT